MKDKHTERKQETIIDALYVVAVLCASATFLSACRLEPSNNSVAPGNSNAMRANTNARTSAATTPDANAAPPDITDPQIDVTQGETEPAAATPAASGGQLLVPVSGVRAEDLRDTYTESRGEGQRSHDAIDIAAPRGTPVLAAADGRIVRLFTSVPGGITIYQILPDNRTILYYAHLDAYADGLSEGQFARRGDVIGYVGDTGNAGAGNYHLHFSVSIADDPKKWWSGTNVNPYPMLRGQRSEVRGQ